MTKSPQQNFFVDKSISLAYNKFESRDASNRGVSQPKVRNLFSELLLAQNKKFTSERFAALNAILTKAGNLKSLLFFEVIDKY